MKYLALLILIGGAMAGYYYTQHRPAPPPVIAPRAPVATPRIAKATPAAATPIPRELTPDGIFVVIKPASIETEDSIIGLKPGDMVEATDAPGIYLFKGTMKIALRPDQITNDVLTARAAISRDASAQAGLQRLLAGSPTPIPIGTAQPDSAPIAHPAVTDMTGAQAINFKLHPRSYYHGANLYVH